LKADTAFTQKCQQLTAWDETLLETAAIIDAARKTFLTDFCLIFNNLIANWQYCGRVSFQYQQGWPLDLSLKQAMKANLSIDLACGFTTQGPHRAELEIFIDEVPAKTMLSRGQQKVFACAMLLAKAIFLQEKAQLKSIFLVDDLNSELDSSSFSLIFTKLVAIGGQIFITGIEKNNILPEIMLSQFASGKKMKMFHVEQCGKISEENFAANLAKIE
jgi:DNA replication and repair protein RecF